MKKMVHEGGNPFMDHFFVLLLEWSILFSK